MFSGLPLDVLKGKVAYELAIKETIGKIQTLWRNERPAWVAIVRSAGLIMRCTTGKCNSKATEKQIKSPTYNISIRILSNI